jgi:hypothetical protein
MPSLPTHLPIQVEQLIDELNELNPPPVVEGPLTSEKEIQDHVFRAGRRSVVDELLRLKEKELE